MTRSKAAKLSPKMIALVWELRRSPQSSTGIKVTLKSLWKRNFAEYRADGLYGLTEDAILWCADEIRTAEYCAYADDAMETRKADHRFVQRFSALSDVVTGTPDELIAALRTGVVAPCGHAFTTGDGVTHFCTKTGGHPLTADHEDATMIFPHVVSFARRPELSDVYAALPITDAWTLAIAEDLDMRLTNMRNRILDRVNVETSARYAAEYVERETVWCERHDGIHFVSEQCVHAHLTDQATRARMNREALIRNVNDPELTTVRM